MADPDAMKGARYSRGAAVGGRWRAIAPCMPALVRLDREGDGDGPTRQARVTGGRAAAVGLYLGAGQRSRR